jgi:hypothetical protein
MSRGVDVGTFRPCPSWPKSQAPHEYTSCSSVRARMWPLPADTTASPGAVHAAAAQRLLGGARAHSTGQRHRWRPPRLPHTHTKQNKKCGAPAAGDVEDLLGQLDLLGHVGKVLLDGGVEVLTEAPDVELAA